MNFLDPNKPISTCISETCDNCSVSNALHKPSRTAYKVGVNVISLGSKPGIEKILPAGVIETTEKLQERIPNSRLLTVPECGHNPHEDAREYQRKTRQFKIYMGITPLSLKGIKKMQSAIFGFDEE